MQDLQKEDIVTGSYWRQLSISFFILNGYQSLPYTTLHTIVVNTSEKPVKMLSGDFMFLWTIIVAVVIVSRCAADQADDIVYKYGRQTLLDLRPTMDSLPPASLLDNLKWLDEVINSRDTMQNNVFMKRKSQRK